MNNSKVIGGEFEIPLDLYEAANHEGIALSGGTYYTSGRTCLYAILKALQPYQKELGGILLPDYICASVANSVKDAGYDFSFYRVGLDLQPDRESLCIGLRKEKIVLLVNYFGMIDLTGIVSVIRKQTEDTVVIIDNVQDYYGLGKPDDFDYAFTSFRKWFPVPDGAEVVVKGGRRQARLPDLDEKNEFAQYKLAGNLLKNFRGEIDDWLCLELINKGEALLDEEYRCKGTDYALAMMESIDKAKCAEKRRENAKILHEGLNRLGIMNVYRENTVPFFVPILLKDRTKLRKKFFEHGIFCPVHWPHESEKLQGENPLYEMELSLICDQRYGEEEMGLILEVLEREYKNM